jgi:hypothetical protein
MNLNAYINKFITSITRNNYINELNQVFFLEYKAFYIACMFESNINIIQDIVDKYAIDVNKCHYGNNAFILACYSNTNFNVIKYLYEKLHINVNIINNNKNNAFLLACFKNTNINIIKYLHAELQLNINCINCVGNNAFNLALCGNENIDCVKYLIEELNFDINYKKHKKYEIYCLSVCPNNKVIKYFIDSGYVCFFDERLFSIMEREINETQNMINKILAFCNI